MEDFRNPLILGSSRRGVQVQGPPFQMLADNLSGQVHHQLMDLNQGGVAGGDRARKILEFPLRHRHCRSREL